MFDTIFIHHAESIVQFVVVPNDGRLGDCNVLSVSHGITLWFGLCSQNIFNVADIRSSYE